MQHSSSPTRRRHLVIAGVWILAAGLMVGCGRGPGNLAPLNAEERTRVEAELLPRFERMHGARIAVSPAAEQGLNGLLQQLLSGSQKTRAPEAFQVWVTQVPDIDAGCLPGGTLWLTEGLVAELDNPVLLAAAMAWGLVQCPAADRAWRDREDLRLPPDRDGDPLAARYRDFRLNSNALLYTLLTAIGCPVRRCELELRQRLNTAGFGEAAWDQLLTVLRADHPQAALVIRTQMFAATGASEAEASAPAWLAEFTPRRDGLVALAESRRRLDAGALLEAYRAGLRARSLLEDGPQVQMHQAELDLTNRHFEYGQRILERLERDGHEVPHADFWWGWVHVSLRRREQAVEHFERALDQLPRVSAHYRHAEALRRLARYDQAERNYRKVLEAGPLHPDYERARIRLQRMDDAE